MQRAIWIGIVFLGVGLSWAALIAVLAGDGTHMSANAGLTNPYFALPAWLSFLLAACCFGIGLLGSGKGRETARRGHIEPR